MTEGAVPDVSGLGHEFAAATFDDGGLLLHLPSGNYFQLDADSGAVWTALLSCSSTELAVASVAERLRVPASRAQALVGGAMASAAALDRRAPTGLPRFHEDEQTLTVRQDDTVALSFDKGSCVLAVGVGLRGASDERISDALRIFAPKIFARWCGLALHASAVELNGRGVLFSGDSGAGKTTTARVLAQHSPQGRALCEDVAVIAEGDGKAAILDGAEAAIQDWLFTATDTLVTRRSERVTVEPLRRALLALDARSPVQKIVFLDRSRRRGQTWSLRPLSRAAALGLLFRHSFMYSAEGVILRNHLQTCRDVVALISAAEAVAIPAGVAALESMGADQIETIAS